MKNRAENIKLRRVFGMVSEASLPEGKTLVMSQSLTPLKAILDLIDLGSDDTEIHQQHRVKGNELVNARAYHARFGSDINAPFPLPAGKKGLLLDECIPLGILPFIKEHFGFSSHVEAEGWSRLNPGEIVKLIHRKDVDTGIAGFTLEQNFGGLITRDHDFKELSRRKDHPASKINIFLFLGNISAEEMRQTLSASRFTMREHMHNKPPALHIFT